MENESDFKFYNYLVDNAEELVKFSKDVNILSASALTQLQRLPLSLRRRAASHNLKRLPYKFRKVQKKEDAANKIVKRCRKFRRRHMNTKEIFVLRQRKNKWLCTHVWHAKRFRMENKWGWRLPMVPNMKTFRPCTKAMSDACCVIDVSHFVTFEICGTFASLLESLKPLLAIDEIVTIVDNVTAGREVTCVLYEMNKYPYGAICPLTMIRLSENSILLSVHPSANSTVVCAFSETLSLQDKSNGCWSNDTDSVVLVDRGGDMCRFRLLGSQCHDILTTLFSDCAEVANLAQWPLTQISTGYSVEISSSDPERRRPRLKETDLKASSVRPWRRTKELPVIVLSKSHFQIEEAVLGQILSGSATSIDNKKHLAPVLDGEKCPLRLIRHGYTDQSGGWDVIIPCKWAMKVWTTLIMKGCRPSGLRYWTRFCAVETSSAVAKYDCFPTVGWPDTSQGRIEAEQSRIDQERAWKRRPRAKRVNFELQATEHPFSCPYESLMPDKDHRTFVMRNTRTLNRIIGPFLMHEVAASTEQLDQFNPEARHSLIAVMVDCLGAGAQPHAVIFASLATDVTSTVIEQAVGAEAVRPQIGFVETADQSMIRGRGRGLGFISYYQLVRTSYTRPRVRGGPPCDLFWIKNPNERRLLPVTLSASQ